MSLSYVNGCGKPSKEAQVQSTSEAERQKWHYHRRANVISLEPGDLVLAKADAYRGRRKVEDQWDEVPYKVEHQVAQGVPSYLMKTSRQDPHETSTETNFFSSLLQRGLLSVWLYTQRGPGAPPPP